MRARSVPLAETETTTGVSQTTFAVDPRAWGHQTDVPVGSLASHAVAGRDLPRSRTSLRSLRRSTATPRSLAIPGPRIDVVRPTPPPTRPPRPRSSVRAFRAFRCVSPHRPTDGARSGLLASALSQHCPSAGLAYTRACRGFGATGGFLQASLSARGHVRPRRGGFRCVSRARTGDSSPDGRASPDPRTDGAPRRRR